MEEVKIDGRVAAIIVRNEFRPDGIQFVTPDDYSQQLGYMRRPAGYVVQPHIHLQVDRQASFTQEVLYMRNVACKASTCDGDPVIPSHGSIKRLLKIADNRCVPGHEPLPKSVCNGFDVFSRDMRSTERNHSIHDTRYSIVTQGLQVDSHSVRM